MPPVLTPLAPGAGPGWDQLAPVVAAAIPADEIDGVWVFRVIRNAGIDWGTAVISRVDGQRRRIYTARFGSTVKGKRRGAFQSTLTEVGSGPLEALHELLAMVPIRSDDEDPPSAVEVASWFPPIEESLPAEPDTDGHQHVSAEARGD